MKNNSELIKKLRLFLSNKEVASFIEQSNANEKLQELIGVLTAVIEKNQDSVFKGVKMIEGEKGEPGKDGVDGKDAETPMKGIHYYTPEEKEEFLQELLALGTPEKGIDYWTDEEIADIIALVTPKKGKDYFTTKEIKEFKNEVTPVKGVDYFDGEKGEQGSPDTSEDIVRKLNQVTGVVELKVLKGLDAYVKKMIPKGDSRVIKLGGRGPQNGTGAVASVNGKTGTVVLTTDDVAEGSLNFYYTNARARTAITLTTIGSSGAATYDSTTGVLNIPSYSGGGGSSYWDRDAVNGYLYPTTLTDKVGINTNTPLRQFHSVGDALFGQNVTQLTATPLNVSFGGTYGSNTPGTPGNLKWDMYNGGNPSDRFGIGMSQNLMEYQAGLSGRHYFYTNSGDLSFAINNTGYGERVAIVSGDSGSYDMLMFRHPYTSGASKNISWRDNTAITSQISSRFNGTSVDLVFGHLYGAGNYQTSDAMIIQGGTNNVGIGGTPTERLHVIGSDTTGNGVNLLVENTATTGLPYSQFKLRTSGTDYGSFFGGAAYALAGIVNGITMGPGNGTQDIGFRTGTSAFSSSASGPTMIIKANQNVGIGVNASYRFHVKSTASWATNTGEVMFEDNSSIGAGVALNATNGGSIWTLISTAPSSAAGAGRFAIFDTTNSAYRLVLDNQGQMGHGTFNPQSWFQSTVGNSDFRFSQGASNLTPTIAVINTSGIGRAAALLAGTGGSGFNFDNGGFFCIQTDSKANFTGNNLGGGPILFQLNANGNFGLGVAPSATNLVNIGGNTQIFNSTFKYFASGGDSLVIQSSTIGASFAVQNANGAGYSGIEYLLNGGTVGTFTGLYNVTGEFRFNHLIPNAPINFKVLDTNSLVLNGVASTGVQGTVSIPSLATGLTAPTTSGTTKMVISDANGLLSFANIPSGGTPGGSTTQLQYNNAGAFGGMSRVTTNGNDLILIGQSAPAYAQGKLVYDTDNESLTFFNNDSNVSLQIGQEEWIRVKNVTGSTIPNGAVVYINGANSGLPTVALAQANAAGTTVGAGLATEAIPNNAIGYVTCIGLVRGLDTSTFTAGQTVYISSSVAGGFTATAPSSPNYRYRVGIVGVSSSTVGTIHVTPSTASLGNGTANQIVGINAAGTAQESKSIVGGYGASVVHSPNTITINAGPAPVTMALLEGFGPMSVTYTNNTFNVNTTAYVSRVKLNSPITATKVSISVQTTPTVAGSFKIALFSSDGATKIFEVTTASISASGRVTTSMSATSIPAGEYYVMFVSVGTANASINSNTLAGNLTLLNNVASEPKFLGSLTVTASTIPTSFDPTAVTSGSVGAAIVRLDD